MIPPDSYALRSPVVVDCWRPFDVDGTAAATERRGLQGDIGAAASSVVHHGIDLHLPTTSSSLRGGTTRRPSTSRRMPSSRSRRVLRTAMKCLSATDSRRQRQQRQQQSPEPTDENQSMAENSLQEFEYRVLLDRTSAHCNCCEFRSDSQDGATRCTVSHSCINTSLPADPRLWSKEDVKTWLKVGHGDLDVDTDRFPMNGKALCLMTPGMFEYRVPSHGLTLFADFRRRLLTAVLACADAESTPTNLPTLS